MVTEYDPDCQTDSRVHVNGTRVPAGEVDIHLRKEGPLDITRYCEGTFVSPWNGEDYLEVFDAIDPDNQGSWDTLKVEVKDHATDEYHLAFHGLVTGVGNSAGPEKEWHYRAQGPGLFVDKIPASQTFSDASVEDVLKYCAYEMAERFPFTIPTDADDIDANDTEAIDNLAEGLGLGAGILVGVPGSVLGSAGWDFAQAVDEGVSDFWDGLLTNKTFQANKHTVADVLEWLQNKSNMRVWFEPYDDGAVLVDTPEPTHSNHDAHYLGGDTYVVDNDALIEINPVNTIVAKGTPLQSLVGVNGWNINKGMGTFYSAKARHKGLYERAGGTEYLAEPHLDSDGKSKDEVANQAKSILKKRIDETTGGDMSLLLRSPIKPFDTITARPTCQTSPATDTKPITYEVSRVHHQIRPSNGSDEKTRTICNVGAYAAMSDIEVVDTWETETEDNAIL